MKKFIVATMVTMTMLLQQQSSQMVTIVTGAMETEQRLSNIEKSVADMRGMFENFLKEFRS